MMADGTAPQPGKGSSMGRIVILLVLLAIAGGTFLYLTGQSPGEEKIKQMVLDGEFFGLSMAEAAQKLGLSESDGVLQPRDPNEQSPGEFYVFDTGATKVRFRVQGSGQVTRVDLLDDADQVIELQADEGG